MKQTSHVPRSPRYQVSLAMAVGTDEHHQLMAMTRNASATGVLLACPNGFGVGDRLSITFKLSPSDRDFQRAEGRVVRHDEDDTASVWRHLVAIRFEQPIDGLGDRLSVDHVG